MNVGNCKTLRETNKIKNLEVILEASANLYIIQLMKQKVILITFIITLIMSCNNKKHSNVKDTIDFNEIKDSIDLDCSNFLKSTDIDYHWLHEYDLLKSDNYRTEKINLLNSEKVEIDYLNKSDTTVTIISRNYSEYKTPEKFIDSYYKINAKGKIIDSLNLTGKELCDNYFGYLINDDSFYTWLIDGSKTKYPCKKINEDFTMTKEQANEKFRLLYEKSSIATMHTVIIYDKDSPSYPSDYIPMFFIDKKWIMLFGSDLDIGLNNSDKFHRLPNLVENEKAGWTSGNKYIFLDYFHKTAYTEEYNSNPLAPITRYHPSKWEGEAYMHLTLKNKIIPFKISLNKIIDKKSESFSPIPFKYYTHKSLNFGMINYNDILLLVKLK